jgi:phage portal protein BeeE
VSTDVALWRGHHVPVLARVEQRNDVDMWLQNYLMPAVNSGMYGLNTTWSNHRVTEIQQTLPGYAAALRSSPPAFAAEMVRALVLSQARFTFRSRGSRGGQRKTFGTRALSILEQPWPRATTGELVSRMEWHAGLAGNAYVVRQRDRLRVLRPDWTAVVYGSDQEPEDAAYALDGEVIGYAYANGGLVAPGNGTLTGVAHRVNTLLPDEVAHWSPIPDPEGSGIGVSWVTPAVREIQADRAATEHKVQFFKNSASPNMVIKGIPATTKAQFDEIVDGLEARHAGVANAFKTLYLVAGADATVVGSNFQQMDLKNIQGGGETRIALLSRVPAPLLGIAEGLAGASLNAGNFGMARRIFADTWVYPSLQDLASCLSVLVDVPGDAELWGDTSDMPILREDGKDAAEIAQITASTIASLVREGFTADSVKLYAQTHDPSVLEHTGFLSVQVQRPGEAEAPKEDVAVDLSRP